MSTNQQDVNGVAVVMVVDRHNQKYLQWSLKSIQKQTLLPVDVVLVNLTHQKISTPDGVTLPVKIINHPLMSHEQAIRTGIAGTTSPFVLLLTGDMVLLDDKHIETCLHELQSSGNDIIGCKYLPIKDTIGGKIMAVPDWVSKHASDGNALLFKRDAFDVTSAIPLRKQLTSSSGYTSTPSLVVLRTPPKKSSHVGLQVVVGSAIGGIVSAASAIFIRQYIKNPGK